MRKEIRALAPRVAVEHARLMLPSARCTVIEPSNIETSIDGELLVMPRESLMLDIAHSYNLGIGRRIVWAETFLRWDRSWSKAQPVRGFTKSKGLTKEDLELMRRAEHVAKSSSDWWRQVGAVLRMPDGSLRESYNHHHPSEYSPYLDGDPRNEFHRGEHSELTTAIHAEASLIASAAAIGLALLGAVYT